MASKKVPLVWGIESRDGTLAKDAKMGNLILQKTTQGLFRNSILEKMEKLKF